LSKFICPVCIKSRLLYGQQWAVCKTFDDRGTVSLRNKTVASLQGTLIIGSKILYGWVEENGGVNGAADKMNDTGLITNQVYQVSLLSIL